MNIGVQVVFWNYGFHLPSYILSTNYCKLHIMFSQYMFVGYIYK